MDGTILQHGAAEAIRAALEAGIIRLDMVAIVVVTVVVIVGAIEAEEEHRKATGHPTRRSNSTLTPRPKPIRTRIQLLPLL